MIGEVIHERYKIEELLKEDALASTYLALDLTLGKSCLVQILTFNPNDAENIPDYLRQLEKIKLHYHPQIPRLQEVFVIEDELWPKICLISQQIEAKALSAVLEEKGRISEVEAIGLLLQLARITEYLHGLTPAYIHQGINPENVLISPDHSRLYLSGYTLMRKDEDGKLYPLNPLPDYIAPEQVRGGPRVQTDLYAIGLTAIEMLSGKHYSQLPSQDIHANLNISTDFANTLKKLVQDDLSQRPQSATALKNELMHVKRLVEEQQKEITVDAPLKRNQLIVPVIAGTLGLIAILFLVSKVVSKPENVAQANSSAAPVSQAAAASQPPAQDPAQAPAATVNPVAQSSATAAAPAANGPATEVAVNIYKDFEYKAGELPTGITGSERELTMDPISPEKFTVEPSYDGSGTVYGKFELGNGADHVYGFAVNGSKVYVDKNNNEDLNDDGPPDSISGPIDLKLENTADGATVAVPYRVMFTPNTKGGFSYSSRCYYTGKLKLGDQAFDAVAFESKDQDGLFKNDGLWVDLNKNGNFETSEHFDDGATVTAGSQTVKLKLNYP